MAADIETYNQAAVEASNLKTHQEQKVFLERHKDVARKNGAKLKLKFPKKPVGFPKPSMGPFTHLGENQLEVYNRCWEVLRYLGTGLHRQNWANRFQSIIVINKGQLVNDTHFPYDYPVGPNLRATKYATRHVTLSLVIYTIHFIMRLRDLPIFFKFTSDSLQIHFRFNSGSLQVQFRSNSDSLQIQFRFTSDSIQAQFRFNSDSIQVHFRFTSGSIQVHFRFNSDSLQIGIVGYEWI
ncbi:hypothetical protein VN97_g5050 [Penicillium thymicola]|uniref:Uncharacterized protein n=1 Tax=Penicillium thymicola TaxID=293382 RepID=A0AAI9TJ23_PENTH|nr:hypothetical protein VN97_g5050 [Penicillium thymicola]